MRRSSGLLFGRVAAVVLCGEAFGALEDLSAFHPEPVCERVEQPDAGVEPACLDRGEVPDRHSAERRQVADAATALDTQLANGPAEDEEILLLLSGHRSKLPAK
jgi:hypothetical protein